MRSFHFSTWPTPYFKYWPQYSFRATNWFVIRRVVGITFLNRKCQKEKWGKHPDYNLFWQWERFRIKLFAITQDSKFFWSNSSFSQPPSDEKILNFRVTSNWFWKFVWENWAQFQKQMVSWKLFEWNATLMSQERGWKETAAGAGRFQMTISRVQVDRSTIIFPC